MANTYTQLNVHGVFSVLGRENLLLDKFRPELFRYITGILKNIKQFPLAVNGYKDHVHIFFELHPTTSISEIMQIVKQNSSKWINDNRFVSRRFNWQSGYGAFTYSRSQRDNVIKYIINQEKHHAKRSFKNEYLELLQKFEIDYNDAYLFDFYDNI
jgi:REP element-mobilizing transposase RayT